MLRIRHPWQHVRCCVCGQDFTAAAWPTRYTDAHGDTRHERCRRDAAGRTARQLRRLAALEASMQEGTL